MLMLIYQSAVQPFTNRAINRLETLNEVLVMISVYLLFAYTEIIYEISHFVMIGWCSVYFLCLIIILNVLAVILISLSTLFTKLRLLYLKRQALKRAKAAQAALIEKLRLAREKELERNTREAEIAELKMRELESSAINNPLDHLTKKSKKKRKNRHIETYPMVLPAEEGVQDCDIGS